MRGVFRCIPWVLIPVGIVLLLVSFFGTMHRASELIARTVLLTVPTDGPIEIELPEAGPTMVWRELRGTHITANRPLLDMPDDLEVIVEGVPTVETLPEADRLSLMMKLFSLERRRTAVKKFDAPQRTVRVEVRSASLGSEQVYSIGPDVRAEVERLGYLSTGGLLGGAEFDVVGTAMLLRRRQLAAMAGMPGV